MIRAACKKQLISQKYAAATRRLLLFFSSTFLMYSRAKRTKRRKKNPQVKYARVIKRTNCRRLAPPNPRKWDSRIYRPPRIANIHPSAPARAQDTSLMRALMLAGSSRPRSFPKLLHPCKKIKRGANTRSGREMLLVFCGAAAAALFNWRANFGY